MVVQSGRQASPDRVRAKFRALAGLSELSPVLRGWTLDTLTALRGLNKRVFTLQDAYALEPQLAKLYPHNRNIRPKIRQQLQVLRDHQQLRFRGLGEYEFPDAE
jgi:type II restriction enzyme